MTTFKLTSNKSLVIEPHDRSVRLVILESGTEMVCRKEKISELIKFIHSQEERAFKGRLQLLKDNDNIVVMVKGEPIGSVTCADFKKGIEQLNHK